MDFRYEKMPRSHVDTAYAGISTVKVMANAAINRIRVKVNEKQSEISGFRLIKLRFRLNFEICNSVSQGIFREFRQFSAIAEDHWPYFQPPKCGMLSQPTFNQLQMVLHL